MGRSVAMRTCLALALVAVVAMATAEDHQVELLDSKDMVKPMSSNVKQLQEEVHYLRNQVDSVAAKTKVDMREKLNAQKEKYFKKMKKAGSDKGKLELATARATTQVAAVTEELGKYKAMVDVLRKKAAFGQGLRRTIAGLQEKMAGAVEATVSLEAKREKDKRKIAQLKGATRSPADIAKIAKLKNKIKELESHHGNLKARIAAEKKKARSAHKMAAKLSKAAAKAHAAGSKHEMSTAAAKVSQAAAEHDNLKSEKEAAKADAKAAKKLAKQAKTLKKKAANEKKEAKKMAAKKAEAKKDAKKAKALQKKAAKEAKKPVEEEVEEELGEKDGDDDAVTYDDVDEEEATDDFEQEEEESFF